MPGRAERTPVKRRLAIWALRCRGWRLAGEAPRLPKYLIVFGPHTCNWDFPLAMLGIAGFGIRPQWLGKHTIFRWPVAGLLRRMGGIPVHRESHEGVVGQIVAAYDAADSLVIGLTPRAPAVRAVLEIGLLPPGPRRRGPGGAGLARRAVTAHRHRADARTHRAVRADMDRIRAFYAPVRGIHAHKASLVRLREEE